MISPQLIQEWYTAARSEIGTLNAEYSKSKCKVETFESGNHYSMISVKIDEASGLTISFRDQYNGGFWNSVGSANFSAVTFLEIVEKINGEIEKRWKFLEDYNAQQQKAALEMDTILRKQISSWRLLGKDVKPP
jgi:hypothetical protein